MGRKTGTETQTRLSKSLREIASIWTRAGGKELEELKEGRKLVGGPRKKDSLIFPAPRFQKKERARKVLHAVRKRLLKKKLGGGVAKPGAL